MQRLSWWGQSDSCHLWKIRYTKNPLSCRDRPCASPSSPSSRIQFGIGKFMDPSSAIVWVKKSPSDLIKSAHRSLALKGFSWFALFMCSDTKGCELGGEAKHWGAVTRRKVFIFPILLWRSFVFSSVYGPCNQRVTSFRQFYQLFWFNIPSRSQNVRTDDSSNLFSKKTRF